MIMTLRAWLTAPFAQPRGGETREHKLTDAPVIMTFPYAPPAPVITTAPGHDDSVMIFRSRLLITEADGCELREAFDRMVIRAPKIAAQVAQAGSLGEIMYSRAIGSLEDFMITKCAVAPRGI